MILFPLGTNLIGRISPGLVGPSGIARASATHTATVLGFPFSSTTMEPLSSRSTTFLPRPPSAAIALAISTSEGKSSELARIRNSSFPALTKRFQMSSASCGSTEGIVTSILSSPSGRIMISLVPDGLTRWINAGMISLALGGDPLLFSSRKASRLSDPIMLIPPRRSTPSFGGHLAQSMSEPTNSAIKTIVIRPLYSGTLSPLVIDLARKMPKATAAIKSRNTNQPFCQNGITGGTSSF